MRLMLMGTLSNGPGALLAATLLLCAPLPAAAQPEAIEYYALDALGSVRVVFDAGGAIVARLDYAPFGRELPASGANAPDRKFAGLFRDEEAGLDYAQARSYQVRTGRFSTVDPLYAGTMNPQRWNRYAYASNNPLKFVDPQGTADLPVNCGAGPQYCPGNIRIGPDEWVQQDSPFNPASYGYQGGAEAAQAEGAYAAGVEQTIFQARETARQQKAAAGASVTTEEVFIVANAVQAARLAQLIVNVAKGKHGEKVVRALKDIGDKAMIVASTGGKVIADGLRGNVISEVKNVAYQALTRQMANYYQILRDNPNMRLDLYVRAGEETRFAAPVARGIAEFEGRVEIIRVIK